MPDEQRKNLDERTLQVCRETKAESAIKFAFAHANFGATTHRMTPSMVISSGELLSVVTIESICVMQAAMDMQMVENIGLLSNAPDNGFVGVNMYVDDSGRSKGLPFNIRASDIGTTCGKPLEVGAISQLQGSREGASALSQMQLNAAMRYTEH